MKIKIITINLFLLLSMICKSQDSINNKTLGIVISTDIAFNTLLLIINDAFFYHTLTIEKYINQKNSIEFSFVLRRDYSYETYYLLDYKYYFSKKKQNQGIYVLPFFVYITEKNKFNKMREYWMGGGGAIGYQKIFLERLSLGINIGMGSTKLLRRENPNNIHFAWDDIKNIPRGEVNIGFKF